MVKKIPPAKAEDLRDAGPIPGLGRSLGGGHSNPLQYSCLENPMDRGDWWAMACAKSLKSCLTLCDPVDCSPPGYNRVAESWT